MKNFERSCVMGGGQRETLERTGRKFIEEQTEINFRHIKCFNDV